MSTFDGSLELYKKLKAESDEKIKQYREENDCSLLEAKQVVIREERNDLLKFCKERLRTSTDCETTKEVLLDVISVLEDLNV